MSATPWTPGPWHARETPREDELAPLWQVDAAPGEVARWNATVGGEGVWPGNIATDIGDEADARLIAAAPEMAELLEDIGGHVFCTCSDHSEWEIEALVILRRIRGEEP